MEKLRELKNIVKLLKLTLDIVKFVKSVPHCIKAILWQHGHKKTSVCIKLQNSEIYFFYKISSHFCLETQWYFFVTQF